MSASDDKVWRLVVDDARVRRHEVRQAEDTAPRLPGPVVDAFAARVASQSLPAAARGKTMRVAAMAALFLGVASLSAWGGIGAIWPETSADHGDARFAAIVSGADVRVDRATAHALADSCLSATRLVGSLLGDPELGTTASAVRGRLLQVLGRSGQQREWPRVEGRPFSELHACAGNAQIDAVSRSEALRQLGELADAGLRAMAALANAQTLQPADARWIRDQLERARTFLK